jgi:5-methylcytosine-specific restriction endonuclease McrA
MGKVPLLRADAHKWGLGLVHQIDEERDATLCGKSPGGCPGVKFQGTTDDISCKLCLRSIVSRVKAASYREQWQQEARDREAERVHWSSMYGEYLQSPIWQSKRTKVLGRAQGVCEGCGERRATQVHHLRYPQGCWPGSDEWLAQEKLFDLRAICRACHEDVHSAARSIAR